MGGQDSLFAESATREQQDATLRALQRVGGAGITDVALRGEGIIEPAACVEALRERSYGIIGRRLADGKVGWTLRTAPAAERGVR